MIREIVDLLNAQDWYIGDEDIDFAKGKYEAQTTIKGMIKNVKRNTYTRWQKTT